MVAIYIRMILSKKMTIEDVPSLWRTKVKEALEDTAHVSE